MGSAHAISVFRGQLREGGRSIGSPASVGKGRLAAGAEPSSLVVDGSYPSFNIGGALSWSSSERSLSLVVLTYVGGPLVVRMRLVDVLIMRKRYVIRSLRSLGLNLGESHKLELLLIVILNHN